MEKEIFPHHNFLLKSPEAITLYHEVAAGLPIIDYHNHLPPALIAQDHQFANLTEVWLKGDHYKWRAMRANGVDENEITGHATDEEKFLAWARTVPYTMRNPLYHWTHLELQRYFGITDLLDENNAAAIYAHCNALLQTKDYSVHNLLRRSKVAVLCTTDDPCDDLAHHKAIAASGFEIKVLPTFRPDAAIAIDNPTAWNTWVNKLGQVTGLATYNFSHFMEALAIRHQYFAEHGCLLSDHGLERMVYAEYSDADIEEYFDTLRSGRPLHAEEAEAFKTAVLYGLALLDHNKGWVAQWHLGALRNTNSRMLQALGADAGVDSIGDFATARKLAQFLNKLDSTNQLSKTILYNLNPAWNEVFASMTGNFQSGGIPGKLQYGSAWWFLDQKDGMEKQLTALSNIGLMSRFVGMLTDSRSFLSFPRHEYFRRILCNMLGTDLAQGELPMEAMPRVRQMVGDISYFNAKSYFF